MTTKELGNLGEKIACEYLVGKGFNILGRNDRISFGEIDIIARKKSKFFARSDKTIHFVEVKAIADNRGGFSRERDPVARWFPEQHVNYQKQRKLKNLAQIWLEKNQFSQNTPYQIDIIGIVINEQTKNAKLHYFTNAIEDV